MKELLLTLPKGNEPKYKRLADAIRNAIREGKIQPGERLPPSREMAIRFKMNRHTVMHAVAELETEGWICAQEKKHYQVTSTLPSTFLQPKIFVGKKFPPQKPAIFSRTVGIGDYPSLLGFKHSFPSGLPDLRLFPLQEFKSHLYDALHQRDILGYGNPAGHERLIAQIATYLRRIRNVSDREIIVTNGSQEAIFLLSQLLIKPGDFVAVEELGYPPAMEALKFAGARLLPIAVDKEGIVVEDLARQLKRKKVKLIYLTPLHQYPTTVTLSASRRLELYEIAYKQNILILEDDYDHEFHFASQPIAPLASFDPAAIVLYVSTFSKVLFPSARMGFMAVPKRIGQEAAKLKRISSRQNEQLLQEAIARWMESGGFEKHLRKMRRAYEERRNSMVTALERQRLTHPSISWITPDGGMALWLNSGEQSERLAERAKRSGILVTPEGHYRMAAVPQKHTHLRLGFTGQTPVENKAGLEALFALLRH